MNKEQKSLNELHCIADKLKKDKNMSNDKKYKELCNKKISIIFYKCQIIVETDKSNIRYYNNQIKKLNKEINKNE